MNLYDLIELYNLWKGEKYVNKNTYEILEEKEYLELSKDEKKNWILLPRFSFARQEQWARKFLKTLPYKESIEKIKNYYMVRFKPDFMHGFHFFCEDHGIWEDYIDFQEKEEIKLMVSWCKENNIPYYAETYVEKQAKRFLESMKDNEKVLEFKNKYINKKSDFMSSFEFFCKEYGLEDCFLKFQEEEVEENWRKFFEEHRHDSEE